MRKTQLHTLFMGFSYKFLALRVLLLLDKMFQGVSQMSTFGIEVFHCTLNLASLIPHETLRNYCSKECKSLSQSACLRIRATFRRVCRRLGDRESSRFTEASCQTIFILVLLFISIRERRSQERTEAEFLKRYQILSLRIVSSFQFSGFLNKYFL